MVRLVEVTRLGDELELDVAELTMVVEEAVLSGRVISFVDEIEGGAWVLIELLAPPVRIVIEATVPVKEVGVGLGIVLENCCVVPGISVKDDVGDACQLNQLCSRKRLLRLLTMIFV